MVHMNTYSLFVKKYSDEQLLSETEVLNLKENKLKAQVIIHLIEIEDRELHLQQGCGSLFSYCQEILRLSESAAGRRIAAARAIRKFPDLYALLVDQRISLATLSLVASNLTPKNKSELLANVVDKSKREVECYLASISDKPTKMVERIKPVTVNKPEPKITYPNVTTTTATVNACSHQQSNSTNTVNCEKNEEYEVEELRFELRFSISDDLMEQFKESLQLLSGKYPKGATIEDAFAEFVKLFLDKNSPKRREERRQASKKSNPCVESAPEAGGKSMTGENKKPTRYISLEKRDQVWLRDEGRCTYINNDKRCTCTHDLEIDHIEPFAIFKNNDISNLRLRCRAHNLYSAKKFFGKSVIEAHFDPKVTNFDKSSMLNEIDSSAVIKSGAVTFPGGSYLVSRPTSQS